MTSIANWGQAIITKNLFHLVYSFIPPYAAEAIIESSNYHVSHLVVISKFHAAVLYPTNSDPTEVADTDELTGMLPGKSTGQVSKTS